MRTVLSSCLPSPTGRAANMRATCHTAGCGGDGSTADGGYKSPEEVKLLGRKESRRGKLTGQEGRAAGAVDAGISHGPGQPWGPEVALGGCGTG